MIYRFTEVLNDLVNYFLLGDILLLEDWKQANHLSDDLAMEFTTNESGDRIFAEGIVIPMTGIENYPYTILFNLSGDRPELCKERNRLQLRKSGYSLKVDHNMLILFTWPILEQFIIIGLAYNPVLYERVTAACKNRAAPGAAMTGKGHNGTPVQPQPCLRSE